MARGGVKRGLPRSGQNCCGATRCGSCKLAQGTFASPCVAVSAMACSEMRTYFQSRSCFYSRCGNNAFGVPGMACVANCLHADVPYCWAKEALLSNMPRILMQMFCGVVSRLDAYMGLLLLVVYLRLASCKTHQSCARL